MDIGGAEGVKKKPDDQEENLDQRLLAILYVRPELEGLAQERMGEYYQSRSPSNDLLNLLAIFADREFPDQTLETLRRELVFTALRLREVRVAARRKILEQQMREAEIAGDDAKIRDLLAQFTRL